jgi:hypothetical protein
MASLVTRKIGDDGEILTFRDILVIRKLCPEEPV